MRYSDQRVGSQTGFTIIELLIVLAIAGLIFLLMLLTIPALQRSGLNNQRKQDVSTILQGISRYALNHTGDFPHGAALDSSDATNYYLGNTKLTLYNPTIIAYHQQNPSVVTLPASLGPQNNPDQLDIYNYATCDPGTPGIAKTASADYRDIVALFAVETVNGSSSQCQQL